MEFTKYVVGFFLRSGSVSFCFGAMASLPVQTYPALLFCVVPA
jgi:hypothetical protein